MRTLLLNAVLVGCWAGAHLAFGQNAAPTKPAAAARAELEQAAQPGANDRADAAAESALPKRTIRFRQVDAEYSVPREARFPHLATQKFAAMFWLRINLPKKPAAELPFTLDVNTPTPDVREVLVQNVLLRVPAFCSAEELRAPREGWESESGELADLTNRVRSPYLHPSADCTELLMQFTVFGHDPRQVQAGVEALLSFVDRRYLGFFRQHLMATEMEVRRKVREYLAPKEATEEQLRRLQKQLGELKEFEDVTQEALSQYVTQRRLIDIDIAATRARLDACQKILSGRADLAPNKISQLEGLKTVAEVELVGYAAKRAALESIIRDGRQYLSRQNEIKLLTQRLKQQTSDIANIEATLAYLKAALEPKTYFGEVVSYDQRGWPHVNEVLIGGVRWQEKRGLDLLPFPGMPGLGDAGTGAVPIPGMPGFGGAGSGAVPMGEMPGASKSGWGSSAAGAMPKGPFPKAKPEPGAKLQASPSPK